MSEALPPPSAPVPVVILMPVYDDWLSAMEVCRGLDRACARLRAARVSILIVDDWSPTSGDIRPFSEPPQAIGAVDLIRLRRNLGNQRAIAVGLSYLYDRGDADAVVVMDSDGEDKPDDAATLIELHLADRGLSVFAERRRRFQGRVFAAGYHLFRLVHWVLTGISVRIGNFSVLPRAAAGALVLTSESWNHYAASAVKARIPMRRVPMDRGRRIAGQSTMNLVSLVTHGLSAVSVFRELVGTRLLIASAVASVAGCGLLAALALLVAAHRLPFDRLTAALFMLTALAMAQGLGATFAIALTILSGNVGAPIIPGRDYHPFIASVSRVHGEPIGG